MDKQQGIDFLNEKVSIIENELSDFLPLECVKALGDTVMDYNNFYFLLKSKHIKGYEKYHEGFIGNDFGDLVQLFLSDGSSIKVMVKRNTFYHTFLSENAIIIDTFECMAKLNEMVGKKFFVTELRIAEPECIDNEQKKFINRTLNFTGIIRGGSDTVDFGSVEAVSQSIIEKIP